MPGHGFTAFQIDLTSQTWLTTEQSDRSVWKHWLTICLPTKVLIEIINSKFRG